MSALERALAQAAFHGPPAGALPLVAGLDPAGPVPDRVRWLAGVCLGALGRYRTAEPLAGCPVSGVTPAGSLAASCLASHLRQLGRHAAAEPLDRRPSPPRPTAEARADALVGLVADAVGRLDLATARRRLERAPGRDRCTRRPAVRLTVRGGRRSGWTG